MKPSELKSIRQTAGLSADAFGRLVGVSGRNPVNRWESGERAIPGPVIVIAEGLRDRQVRKKAVMSSPRIKHGHVYVISATNGFVKLGSAGKWVYTRFGNVAGSSPLPVTLSYICECEDPVGVEHAAHLALDKFRSHREWFDVPAAQAIEVIRGELKARGKTIVAGKGRPQNGGAPLKHQADLCEVALKAAAPAPSRSRR